jgi:5-(carboxyamino)imidazole ribonucleotide synthase
LVAVRGREGQTAYYPLVENRHDGGILSSTLAPAPQLSARLQREAQEYLQRLMQALRYVGVLTVEFFQCGGRLLANEMAPRVHNSGHWTIEGAETSQFENHLRAGLGLPLGSTRPRGRCLMLNLLGSVPPRQALLSVPGVHVHLYGKRAQPGRKLGHVTICGGRDWPETPPELVALGLPRVASHAGSARRRGAEMPQEGSV